MDSKSFLHSLFISGDKTPVAVSISLFILILCIHFLNKLNFKYLRSPGPWGIPILGFYPFLRKEDYHVHLKELADKYGDAYLISMLGKRYLHLSSSKAVRETFITKSNSFLERPQEFSLFQYLFKDGVIYLNGDSWHTIRKYVVQGMRELGIGPKEQLKNPLLDSINELLNDLQKSQCQPINMTNLLHIHCTNVIKHLILGDNISASVSQELNDTYLECMPIPTLAHIFVGNVARYLVLNRVPGYKEMIKGKDKIVAILQKILAEHKRNFDPEYPRDLIDIYLREKKMREEQQNPQAAYFTDMTLISTLIQIYGDGGSSIGSTIAFYLKYLAQSPDIQEELFQEIKREIGIDKIPTYEDRIKIPLMNSVIKELERFMTSSIPVISTLQSSCDTTISGVYVPKGTIVLLNHYAIHQDPKLYKDAINLNLKRFVLDKETKRPKEDLPILFGVGKRSCAGESLVITEIFVFLTAIIQRFTFKLAEEQNTTHKSVEEDCIIIVTPR